MIEGGASVMLLGLLLGLQHATDPDHVVAVATIVSRTNRPGAGALVGACWGIGHTATIGAVGALIIAGRVSIGPVAGLTLELAVAAMLLALGGWRIFGVLRDGDAVPSAHLSEAHAHGHDSAFHSHAHDHGGHAHSHPHVHPSPGLLRALRVVGPGQAARSVAIGVVHGLAGSAAIALLALSTIASPAGAVAYLLLFGVGTVAGMTAITTALAASVGVFAPRVGRWRRGLALGTGALSMALGLYLAVHIGFVDGLFLGVLPRLSR